MPTIPGRRQAGAHLSFQDVGENLIHDKELLSPARLPELGRLAKRRIAET
jgi:hypothetical protein